MRKSLVSALLPALVVAGAAAVLALPPAAAAATTPAAVSFSDSEHSISGTPGPGYTFDVVAEGTTVASGAVSGSFALVDHTQISGGGTIDVDRTLSADSGTITIEIAARFVSATATTLMVQGDWTIVTGTGSYSQLHGSGSYSATVQEATHTITGTLSGFADYDAGI
jgi:hypothetical protein